MATAITIRTTNQTELIDITRQVERVVTEKGVRDGLCCIFIPHTTAGVTINEGADPDVQKDILAILNEVIPFRFPYCHAEGNSPAHIKASIMGSSVKVIVESGKFLLGTWQSIFFCEFDGPRTRRVYVKVIEG
ncbi:MAG: secondary thiamine-phosphate synthase enzyme YjbQ [Thermodesulfobacteriota bacterium]